jgi:hypothetical protein
MLSIVTELVQSISLDNITKLIQSPPGQLAAGGVLAGIVWKFFERVEAVLKNNMKVSIIFEKSIDAAPCLFGPENAPMEIVKKGLRADIPKRDSSRNLEKGTRHEI